MQESVAAAFMPMMRPAAATAEAPPAEAAAEPPTSGKSGTGG